MYAFAIHVRRTLLRCHCWRHAVRTCVAGSAGCICWKVEVAFFLKLFFNVAAISFSFHSLCLPSLPFYLQLPLRFPLHCHPRLHILSTTLNRRQQPIFLIYVIHIHFTENHTLIGSFTTSTSLARVVWSMHMWQLTTVQSQIAARDDHAAQTAKLLLSTVACVPLVLTD